MVRSGLAPLVILLLAGGCAGPGGGTPAILTDDRLLQPGPDGGPVRVYHDPRVDLAAYDQVLLDPVTVWSGRQARAGGITQAQAQTLADAIFTILYDALARDLQLVSVAGERTLRIQVALTKPGERELGLGVVSTVVPQFRLVAELRTLDPGAPASLGEAALELRVLDATRGDLLAASIDRWISGPELSTWAEVEAGLAAWAETLRQRLCPARDAACVAPDGT